MALGIVPSRAQSPKHEMRGVWLTTVFGLDWPDQSFRSSDNQIASLTSFMDDMQAVGMNAVFFQIRSEADAMYESPLEPWSRFLTGEMGVAPDPYYDPLELAIELAHERGMELHAWINPFRAMSSLGPRGLSHDHITSIHPEWILQINNTLILDPGIPDVRDYIRDVVIDVVLRYDVDGVHFDDFFYPYPPNVVGIEDESTFNTHGTGFLNITNWRRDNINQFVAGVAEGIRDARPGVKFGISPFGIWKDGVPPGIHGLDAFNVIYSDPVTWMAEGTVDYLVPQLYWPFGGAQDFEILADWWVSQSSGVHIYPGTAAYRVDSATSTGTRFSAAEIPLQIDFVRATEGLKGNVFFRASNIRPAADNLGLSAALKNGYYPSKAFTPQMGAGFPPDAPGNLTAAQDLNGVFLRWDPPFTGYDFANKFGVYRLRMDSGTPDIRDMTNNPDNLIAISWDPEYRDRDALEVGGRYFYAVTGVSRASLESAETNLVDVVVVQTGVDALPLSAVLEWSVYPNPVRERLSIAIELKAGVSLDIRIYDVLGRMVTSVTKGSVTQTAGNLHYEWDLSGADGSRLVAGTYFVVLRTRTGQQTRPVVILR